MNWVRIERTTELPSRARAELTVFLDVRPLATDTFDLLLTGVKVGICTDRHDSVCRVVFVIEVMIGRNSLDRGHSLIL